MEAGDWTWLWRQHNEHRIIFPELVFAADELWFSGNQVLPLIASFTCYLATVVLLGCTFWRGVKAPGQAKLRALLLGGVIAGWPLTAFVLGTPFLLQWTLLQCAVISGLLAASSPRLPLLAISIACGFVGTFSSANGVLLWPILLSVAACRGMPRGRLIALAISAVAAVGLFLVGYHRPSTPSLASLRHAGACFGFVLSYLSMPFGVLRHPTFGITFGLLSLAVWLTCLISTFRRRTRSVSRCEAVAFGYFFFLLLTAALTSLARVEVGDPGFSNAKAARYLTLPLLGWASCVPLVYAVSLRHQWRVFAPRLVLIATVAVVAFMQIRLGRWLRTNDNYVSHQQWAAASLENGVFDPASIGSVFPKQEFIEHYLPMLRSRHKSIFAGREFQFLRQEFRSIFPNVSNADGGILRITHVQGGVSIVGWAANLEGRRGTAILLVSERGEVVGVGRQLQAGIPREIPRPPVKQALIWVGYINSHYPSKSFTPFEIGTDDASAFRLAPRTSIPQ